MTTTHVQTCNRCHRTAPLAELDLFHVFADIGVECKDRDACRRRADAWNAENHVNAEGHDMRCESEFVSGPMAWSPCDCPARAADREEAVTCQGCGDPLTAGGLAKGERFCSAACANGEVVAS